MKRLLVAMLFLTIPAASWALWLTADPGPGPGADDVVATQILPDSAAEKAGVKPGDIALSLGTHTISSCPDLVAQVKAAPESTTITVKRDGKILTLPLTLAPADGGSPRLGLRCTKAVGWGVAFSGLNSLTVGANVSDKIALVRLLIVNNSQKTVHLSPSMVNAADGTRTMLRHLSNADATDILQGERPAPAQGAVAVPETGDNGKMAQTLSSFLFSRIGLGGQAGQLASQVVGTAASATSAARNAQAAAAVAAPATPTVTRSKIDEEALAESDLEPGYSAEGLVYLTGVKTLPLTVMVTLDGKKTTFTFRAPPVPAAASKAPPQKKT